MQQNYLIDFYICSTSIGLYLVPFTCSVQLKTSEMLNHDPRTAAAVHLNAAVSNPSEL